MARNRISSSSSGSWASSAWQPRIGAEDVAFVVMDISGGEEWPDGDVVPAPSGLNAISCDLHHIHGESHPRVAAAFQLATANSRSQCRNRRHRAMNSAAGCSFRLMKPSSAADGSAGSPAASNSTAAPLVYPTTLECATPSVTTSLAARLA